MKILNFVFTRSKNVLPEQRLAAARQKIIDKCDLLVDIGANDGKWMENVRKDGYIKQALCIEPGRTAYGILNQKKIINTNTLNCAVGNKNGYVQLNQASNAGLSSSILDISGVHQKAAPKIKYIAKEKVKILKLSKILEHDNHSSLYIKIDTQGYEFEVLKSINKKDFEKIYAFEIELNLVSSYKNVTLIEDVIKFLRKRGYSPLRIENGFGMPNFGQQIQVDVLFTKN